MTIGNEAEDGIYDSSAKTTEPGSGAVELILLLPHDSLSLLERVAVAEGITVACLLRLLVRHYKIRIDRVTGHEATRDAKSAISYAVPVPPSGRWNWLLKTLARVLPGRSKQAGSAS